MLDVTTDILVSVARASLGTASRECPLCERHFPVYYENKGHEYYGDRGRYNFRGAMANFRKHIRACRRSYPDKAKAVLKEAFES